MHSQNPKAKKQTTHLENGQRHEQTLHWRGHPDGKQTFEGMFNQ